MSSPASEVVVFDAHLIEEREYWRSRLEAGWHGSAPWPDFDGVSRGGAFCTLSYKFGAELSGALRRMSGGSAFLYYTILLAGLKVTLFRYTGQRRSAIGSPALRQWGRENALVIAEELEPQATFRELLTQLRETLLAAYARQRYPFARLLKDLQLKGSQTEGCPLFAVAARLEELHLEMPAVGQSIEISFARAGEELRAEVKYESGRYREESVTQLLRHCEQLLGSAVRGGAEQRVSELELLSAEERRYLLEELNRTEREDGGGENGAELVAAQARRSAAAVAVEDEQERVSYAELERRAGLVGAGLRRRGVKAEALVGVMMERSVGLVVGLLGVLKAGGAYVPLERSEPVERVREVIGSSGISLVLTQAREQAAVAEKLGASGGAEGQRSRVAVVTVEELQQEGAGAENGSRGAERGAGGDNLAYVIYTSGSTGKPKGVMISHRAICNRLWWMQDEYRLTSDDCVLQKTPYTFDVSVWEFFWPLITGARLVMARPGGHHDSAYLARLIAKRHLTTLHFVPSMLQVFLEEEGLEETCRSLRRVISSGEALSSESQEKFFKRVNAKLHNLYGPTEAAVDVTFWECKPETRGERVPIGHPIANLQTYILDQQMQPVPVGVTGELYLGGVGLARGYQQQPGLTAERFVPHPFAPVAGARLYRTGDVVRHRRDGAIEFLGRVDHQVKLRGYRIELGEIESVLRQHEAVQEAVVVARGAGAEQRLVGYVTAAARNGVGGRELSRRLREYLQGRVPEYMVPAALMVLERMPLSANGKLDRAALPEPDSGPGGGAEREGPRNATEALIAEVWQQVLGLESVSVHDNFFELGGDSILGIQVVARLRQAGLVLTPRQLFQHQSSAALAQVAGALGRVAASQESGAREESGAAVVLTPIQRRFFAESGAEKHHWNQAVLLASRERLEPERLRRVVAALVARHDALRLRYEQESDGEWRQYVAGVEGAGVPLTSIDLRALGKQCGQRWKQRQP